MLTKQLTKHGDNQNFIKIYFTFYAYQIDRDMSMCKINLAKLRSPIGSNGCSITGTESS